MTITRSQTSYIFQFNMLATKQKGPNGDTSALERQIDEMVYAGYSLTPEEIAIVEGKR